MKQPEVKFHLFRSQKRPGHSIIVGELLESGFYFLPAAHGKINPRDNIFSSIEEIEIVLDDKLEMIIPEENKH